MRIFGHLCAGALIFGAYVMFKFVSNSVSRYDYIAGIMFSAPLLAVYLALFSAVTAVGKLDFLGWPRLLQYSGAIIAALSVTVLMGMSAADHGAGGQEYPWSIRPFCPWAAYMLPFGLAVIAVFWLNAERFEVPEFLPRAAFCGVIAVCLLSNIIFGLEIRHNLQVKDEEQARTDLLIIQQTDAEKEFSRLLMYTYRTERPAARQMALQKILATGPRYNALLTASLREGFGYGLTYLRDNDPPGDGAPLAEPARDAIFLAAKGLRGEIQTGRALRADDVKPEVDSVLTVADKFSKYGVDFLPAVNDYHAALVEAPKSAQAPRSSIRKIDAWLAAKAK